MRIQKSFSGKTNGTLYLVPTPIGNLEDMTYRAVRILQQADFIAAEDTRNTQKLINHFDIQTPQLSFHEHNLTSRVPELIKLLNDGKKIAQVSDAGMPSISDPGKELVEAVIEEGFPVVPLPGANAAITALIASGISPQPFYFHGFLPRKKKELISELEELNKKEETLLFYESPHRLKQLLQIMEEVYGEKRKIVLARELTKKYEEFIRGTIKEAGEWAQTNQIRGEFVIVLEGNAHAGDLEAPEEWVEWSVKEHVVYLMKTNNMSSKSAIKEVAKARDMPKREVYSEYHEI